MYLLQENNSQKQWTQIKAVRVWCKKNKIKSV